MNDRIKELHIKVLKESENMRWNIEDSEKFAELIVRECIRVVQNDIIRNGPTPENERSYLHVFALRSHFGIKE